MRFKSVSAGLLMAILCVSALAQDSLGRLLTTPQERQLIANRHPLLVQQTQTSRLRERLLRFDGVVRRDDGRLDVWIDGRLIVAPRQLRELGVMEVLHDKNPQLVIRTGEGAVFALRPGQVFDRQQQRVLEPWQVTAELLAGQVDAQVEATMPAGQGK